MTEEEIEKQAEGYAVENWEYYEEGQTDYTAINKAFQDGAKWMQEKLKCCGNCKHVYKDCAKEKDCKQNKYKHWEQTE